MFDYDLSERPRFSPWAQFAILLVLTGVGLVVGSLIAIFIALSYLHVPTLQLQDALLKNENAGLSRIIQFVSTFFAMAITCNNFCTHANRNHFLTLVLIAQSAANRFLF